MRLKFDKAEKIKNSYVLEYMIKDPYFDYVKSVSVSTIENCMKSIGGKVKLKKGDKLEDICLSVDFQKKPPKSLRFPSEYKSLRVFYTEDVSTFKKI